MIVVTVELLPKGDASRKRLLGRCLIHNDGTSGTTRRGNYVAVLWNRGRRAWRSGRVLNFPRESLNAWHLLARVLDRALSNGPIKDGPIEQEEP